MSDIAISPRPALVTKVGIAEYWAPVLLAEGNTLDERVTT